MNSLSDDVIRELQQEYISTFPEKLETIKTAFDEKNWKGLLQVFHKLAGSGATYEMPEISELCRGVEGLLIQTADPSPNVVSESIDVLRKIFDHRSLGKAYNLESDPILKKIGPRSVN